MLDQRDLAEFGGAAAGRHAPLAERGVAYGHDRGTRGGGVADMGTWMPCTPISKSRRMKAGSNPGVRTIGVIPARSAAITASCTSCRSQ